MTVHTVWHFQCAAVNGIFNPGTVLPSVLEVEGIEEGTSAQPRVSNFIMKPMKQKGRPDQ